jgi:hypothetical protein
MTANPTARQLLFSGLTLHLLIGGPARDGPSISLSIGLRREPLVLVVVLVLES